MYSDNGVKKKCYPWSSWVVKTDIAKLDPALSSQEVHIIGDS